MCKELEALDRNIVVIREKDYTIIEQALLELRRLDLLLKLSSEQSSSHFTYKDKNLVCMQLTNYDKLMYTFLELQAIKEAKPSEALELFNKVDNVRLLFTSAEKSIIKQALIKAQEQEKVLEILKKYVYYSNQSHCIRMREIRKSTRNFDYEYLKDLLKEIFKGGE